MHAYGVREVEKLLQLPRSTIRALIKAGFVTPERGPRNAWFFSFQDLLVLRTARALLAARVPHRRITRAIRELRRQAASGQLPLAFDGDAPASALIEQQSVEKFDPSAYTDEVRARVEAAVQKKVEGQEITMAEVPEQGAQVIDLMEALRASLEKKPAKQAVKEAAPAKPAPAKKAAKK